MSAWTNCWTNIWVAGNMRRHSVYVTALQIWMFLLKKTWRIRWIILFGDRALPILKHSIACKTYWTCLLICLNAWNITADNWLVFSWKKNNDIERTGVIFPWYLNSWLLQLEFCSGGKIMLFLHSTPKAWAQNPCRGAGFWTNFLRSIIFFYFSTLSKHTLYIEYHVYIWQVSS